MSRFPISVLDQSPCSEGMTAADAFQNTLDLARVCDAAGFHRYWVSEHHASPGLAGCSPEVLIGPIALTTSSIRVGSGGIMLPHYSPFKVAEAFSTIGAMAPNRIDLGIGRAPGGHKLSALALQRDRTRKMSDEDFPKHLAELLGYLGNGLPERHPFAILKSTLPTGGGQVSPWLLGASADSAAVAAEMGIPYCIADFINSDGISFADTYRRHFRPSHWLDTPYLMVATFKIVAESSDEAEVLAAPMRMMLMHLAKGELIPVPSVEKALAWMNTNSDPLPDRRIAVGSPDRVRIELEQTRLNYGADELMLVNLMHDHSTRVRSYQLIAREFAIQQPALAA